MVFQVLFLYGIYILKKKNLFGSPDVWILACFFGFWESKFMFTLNIKNISYSSNKNKKHNLQWYLFLC